MKKIYFYLIAIILVFQFTSCATMFTGTKDTIYFESEPAGARVLIDGIEVCKTPCSASVKRSLNSKRVEFRLDNYKTRILTLENEFNTVGVLNIFTGCIGFAIDLATGSFMKYDRRAYNVELEEKLSSIDPKVIEIDTKNKTIDFYVVQN